VTSLTIDHLDPPSTARRMRAVEAVRRRALDELSGRTVWCASALPGRRASARRLRASLQWAGGGGLRSGVLEVDADERLRDLAQRLEAMLEGSSPSSLGDAERELCAEGVRVSEDLVGAVSPDDVVVVHDALTALLAEALRERGAHAVWRVSFTPAPSRPTAAAAAARTFLHRYTSRMDAYVMTWSPYDRRPRAVVERIAALMPSTDAVAAKDIPADYAGGEPRQLGWSTVLADVVNGDREETVGGTRHARPRVPVR
jgi:hypothetical protein